MKREQPVTRVGRVLRFLRRGLWDVQLHELSWMQRGGVKALRVCSLVANGFRRDQCSLHAASLTFFSMMALVPVLVLALALARAFGGADLAKQQLDEQLDAWMSEMEQAVQVSTADGGAGKDAAHEEVTRAFSEQFREVTDQLFEQVNKINFGKLGGIGLVMLLWTVIGVLGKVESSFNQVWNVEKPRPFVRKFADYLAMILILPFLFTAASTVPVAGMIADVMDKTVGGTMSVTLKHLLHSGLLKNGLALAMGTALFSFLLGFMPNTRVQTFPAVIGGAVTMVLFGGWLKICAMAQVGIASYSALYGGFAVLPILLMLVYTSWQIILLGAEITFAIQNRDTYMREQYADEASLRARLLLALTLCVETSRRARGQEGGPFAAEEYVRQHGVPQRFARRVLDGLVRDGVLAEVAERPGEYLLCRCDSGLSVSEIAKNLLNDGEPPEALGLGKLDTSVAVCAQRFESGIEEALSLPLAKV